MISSSRLWEATFGLCRLLTGIGGVLGNQVSFLAGCLACLCTGILAGSNRWSQISFLSRRIFRKLFFQSFLALLCLFGIFAVQIQQGSVFRVGAAPRPEFQTLVAWLETVKKPMHCVVLGPPGHRSVRAAVGLLETLKVFVPRLSVSIRDPGVSGAIPGLPRPARIGEILITAGGRRALVPDASLRTLAAGFRGLGDPAFRSIRFVSKEEAPGAPEGYRRAAATLASHLGASVTQGAPHPRSRLWILLPDSPDVLADQLSEHMQGGGSLLVFDGSQRKPGVSQFLKGLGVETLPGWLLDAERGPRKAVSELRVRPQKSDSPFGSAIFAGCRPLRSQGDLPFLTERIVPWNAGKWDQGEHPDSGGTLREAPDDLLAGIFLEPPRTREPANPSSRSRHTQAFLAVLGDAEFASDAGFRRSQNREFLLQMAAWGMDRVLGLPRESWVPQGGIDPDLNPHAYAKLAFLLLAGLPGLAAWIAWILSLSSSSSPSSPKSRSAP